MAQLYDNVIDEVLNSLAIATNFDASIAKVNGLIPKNSIAVLNVFAPSLLLILNTVPGLLLKYAAIKFAIRVPANHPITAPPITTPARIAQYFQPL